MVFYVEFLILMARRAAKTLRAGPVFWVFTQSRKGAEGWACVLGFSRKGAWVIPFVDRGYIPSG